MFVRLVNSYNHADLVISAPEDWVAFKDVPGSGGVPARRLTSASPRTPKGTIPSAGPDSPAAGVLQVGRTTNSREAILKPSGAASC